MCHRRVRPRGDGLGCAQCGRTYPIVHGVPVLLPEDSDAFPLDSTLPGRNGYDPWIPRTAIESLPADAVILEIGAGNMEASRPNLIRMDVTLTPHVDVVGDAHALPFLADTLDFVFSLAVVEHLRQPWIAAEEMLRVLRPGGYVYAECSFVFPFHGHPHHYFNASHIGMRELFRRFTPVRAGVGPHQMPSFALRAFAETYRFFLEPHQDEDARRLKERLAGILGENLEEFDTRFDQETALRVAACTYFFGAKDPGANQVIPAPVLEAYGRRPDLKARFPMPLDIGADHNVLAWALSDEGLREEAIAAFRAAVVPFDKNDARPVSEPEPVAPPWLRRARAAGERLVHALDNGHAAGWTMEEITDGGERVTHLFPNDCFVAHRSLYHFAVPFVADATVLDAGSGAGYGAAHLAERGARQVLGVDASPKAVAFSRHHFPRPNLRFEVRDLERLRDLELRAWDVVVCSNVLEHVPDADRFLRAVWGLLRADGLFVLAVPPIVNDSLRAQNLANPYHLNIWSPRQWAHALGRYFADVEAYQHWYELPGVELNLSNTPAETVVREEDFVFRPVGVQGLYDVPTITAVFTARHPVAADALPTPGGRLPFVDDSFTRPPPPPRAPAPEVSLPRKAWRALRRRVS